MFMFVDNNFHYILSKGFIRVIDTMGHDESIVDAARISYGSSNSKKSSTATLINYLMKHNHTSPFEMCEIKFHIKMPIFVARQWMRHRAGHFNEVSGRYTQMADDMYIPNTQDIARQCPDNKQSRAKEIVIDSGTVQKEMVQSMNLAYKTYQNAIKKTTAREIARAIMPLCSYTEIFWKVDLHNFMKFIQLRIADNAQFEIREYAKVLLKILEEWCPYTFDAFQEYKLQASCFSASQTKLLKQLIAGNRPTIEASGLGARDYAQVMTLLQ